MHAQLGVVEIIDQHEWCFADSMDAQPEARMRPLGSRVMRQKARQRGGTSQASDQTTV